MAYTTENRAIDAAVKRARRANEWRYVVYEPEEGYEVATDEELATFFAGASPSVAVSPMGRIER